MGRLKEFIFSLVGWLLRFGIKTSLLVILLIGSFVLLGNYLNLTQTPEPVDAVVVLSGGDTKSRAQAGIDLYKAGWSNLIIFSGAAADSNSKSNAEVMKQQAIKAGIPEKNIILDQESKNTSENAREVNKTILKLKLDKVILVTSGYHIRRARAELHNQNSSLKIIVYASNDRNWHPNTWWLTPYGWWVTPAEALKLLLVSIR